MSVLKDWRRKNAKFENCAKDCISFKLYWLQTLQNNNRVAKKVPIYWQNLYNDLTKQEFVSARAIVFCIPVQTSLGMHLIITADVLRYSCLAMNCPLTSKNCFQCVKAININVCCTCWQTATFERDIFCKTIGYGIKWSLSFKYITKRCCSNNVNKGSIFNPIKLLV